MFHPPLQMASLVKAQSPQKLPDRERPPASAQTVDEPQAFRQSEIEPRGQRPAAARQSTICDLRSHGANLTNLVG
jgi:hypothetical protein